MQHPTDLGQPQASSKIFLATLVTHKSEQFNAQVYKSCVNLFVPIKIKIK